MVNLWFQNVQEIKKIFWLFSNIMMLPVCLLHPTLNYEEPNILPPSLTHVIKFCEISFQALLVLDSVGLALTEFIDPSM